MSFSHDIFLKKFFSVTLIIFQLLTAINKISASQGIATSGTWNNSSTWMIGGVARTPACGDTLVIPSDAIVTVSSMQDYTSCNVPMFISVEGVLQFTNGNKLDLPCGSAVNILPGGILMKSTPGGGNSTHIDMCGCTSWQAGDGIINGPNTLGCFTLPVSLLLFTAEQNENSVDLHWVTASEKNNNYFTLERSADGESFTPLAKLPGAGNSITTKEYTGHDYAPEENITYYRLKQTDLDGRSSYSDIIAIRYTGKKSSKIISCFVNRSKTLDVLFYEVNDAITSINVYDTTGNIIYTAKNNSERGINHLKLNIPFNNTGCYYVNLANEWEVMTEKVVFEN